MAGRKKLFKNYVFEHILKVSDDSGLSKYIFKDLAQEQIPQYTNIGALVYHAPDVYRKKYVVYKIRGYERTKDEKIVFMVNDYYKSYKDGIVKESLGADRTFYQESLILVPEDYAAKKHRSIS